MVNYSSVIGFVLLLVNIQTVFSLPFLVGLSWQLHQIVFLYFLTRVVWTRWERSSEVTSQSLLQSVVLSS